MYKPRAYKGQFMLSAYYIICGQDQANLVFWLATQAGKTGSSWPLGIFPMVPLENIVSDHVINPLLTKLASLTSSQSVDIYIQTTHLFNNAYIVTPNRGRHLTSLCSWQYCVVVEWDLAVEPREIPPAREPWFFEYRPLNQPVKEKPAIWNFRLFSRETV